MMNFTRYFINLKHNNESSLLMGWEYSQSPLLFILIPRKLIILLAEYNPISFVRLFRDFLETVRCSNITTKNAIIAENNIEVIVVL